ncbi:LamG-like jellyroll fold domain-containing protein [Parachryseolinea silvisoli]|uniref:LamG-like jellyroll fold domain-containing protein n=1 Tax=Parachryseolinea silvisoli TaxID=2873601 RepID=UPI002265F5CC|nr:LamG-like jellyroll fold domain-containing protein [Parachryseolinea silvisoli]MCD9019109.1 gliding motility-associated C-terminal domain-containing protein [Parachryseolinea silvisoli]
MRFSVVFAVFLSFASSVVAQTIDYVGSGRALQFDGVDDYVDLGNIYDDVKLPLTISVWTNLDNSASGLNPIFTSQDNSPLYNGFWFQMSENNFSVEYGDGQGEDNPAYRRAISSTVGNKRGRWIHLTAVMRGATDMDLYLNGVRVNGNPSGSSDLPMASNFPNDVAKIGYYVTNSTVYRFKGMLDDLRIWDRALTETEIRATMCRKLTGTESGLIGYWNFDETSGATVKDVSSKHYDGILHGNPTRVYSGAAIGDESTYLYPAAPWTTATAMVSADGTHELVVKNVKGAPQGMHLYRVNALPSQTGGLDMAHVGQPYFGVFSAGSGTGYTFDLEYLYDGHAPCTVSTRTNNSGPTWETVTTTTGIADRFEVLRNDQASAPITVGLGPDQLICDQPSRSLTATTPHTGTFLWSTGATTPTITINASGSYWVELTNGCRFDRDTVEVTFRQKPVVSLGVDKVLCVMVPGKLQPVTGVSGDYAFTWQDGSTQPVYDVRDFGKYWVEVTNACGMDRDTVEFAEQPQESIVFDLGEERRVCDQPSVQLSTDLPIIGRTFLWSTGATTPSIAVTTTGEYWVTVENACTQRSDTIRVTMDVSLVPFTLGEDEVACEMKERVLVATVPSGASITWQDGSTSPTLPVKEFGVYWVDVRNGCGAIQDTVTFTKLHYVPEFMPNIITPNGDDWNEYFIAIPNPDAIPVALQVYNRWGMQVYQEPLYKNDWNGGGLTTGVYFYRLTGACIPEQKGMLTIR